MIYLLIAVGLTPGGSSALHIYTQTVHGTTQLTRTTQLATEQHNNKKNTINNLIGKSAGRAPSLRVVP